MPVGCEVICQLNFKLNISSNSLSQSKYTDSKIKFQYCYMPFKLHACCVSSYMSVVFELIYHFQIEVTCQVCLKLHVLYVPSHMPVDS